MQPGDIILSLGTFYTSKAIAKITEVDGERWSHAALIVAIDPYPIIVQAVPPQVECCLLEDLCEHSEKVMLLHDLTLSDIERKMVVYEGMQCVRQLYGFDRFPGLLLDEIFETDWFGDHLFLSRKAPVCSVVVAAGRDKIGKDFGVKAQGANPSEIGAFSKTSRYYERVTIK